MLVCSVALRPVRAAITATVFELADAADTPSLGIAFATLTDDPGNALDILDAFAGSRLVEAAGAAAVLDALSAHPAFVVEEISAAISVQDAAINVVVPLVARHAMFDPAMVNSDGTARQANVAGTMVNL